LAASVWLLGNLLDAGAHLFGARSDGLEVLAHRGVCRLGLTSAWAEFLGVAVICWLVCIECPRSLLAT